MTQKSQDLTNQELTNQDPTNQDLKKPKDEGAVE
jgi:hypothetical protein